jgi:hypothetical protein
MEELSRSRIRMIIIFGFVLAAVANVIFFFNSVNSIGSPDTFRGILDLLVDPLGTIAAVCAWTALTRLEVRDGVQRNILRHAYLFFAIEYLIFSVGYNYLFTQRNSFGGFWTTLTLWLEFVGTLITAVGFLLMWRELSRVDRDEQNALN